MKIEHIALIAAALLGGAAGCQREPEHPTPVAAQQQALSSPLEVNPKLRSLRGVAVPEPQNLGDYVKDRLAAVQLGKALFWDQQVGSDGQACASCHFQAGADNRTRNQLSTGFLGGNGVFDHTRSGAIGPNVNLSAADFPTHVLADPFDRNSQVLFDSDDPVTSQGVARAIFGSVDPATGAEQCTVEPDSDGFRIGATNVRRVEPRNTPTVINAAFNFRNFWDGRANNVFNGVDPFGRRSTGARVLEVQEGGSVSKVPVDLRNSSLASQAVGPALSPFEMSCAGRTFPHLGRKLLRLRPLGQQRVSPADSALGALSRAPQPGLSTTYAALIQRAFHSRLWDSERVFDGAQDEVASPTPGAAGEFSLMESNFSLFWGLAIQLYEATLVSDDTPFDRFMEGNTQALTAQQRDGLAVFQGPGLCVNCHNGPEFTSAGTRLQPENEEGGLVERMIMGSGQIALYDSGFYNIGVRPTAEDVGVGGLDPFGKPLSFTRQYLDLLRGRDVRDPFEIDPCRFDVPVDSANCSTPPDLQTARVAVDGAFKVPTLRNVELTGPYFHNGGQGTLEQVVDFYNRGGDRRGQDGDDTTGTGPKGDGDVPQGGPRGSNLDADIRRLGLTQQQRTSLVAFLKSLTDDRVRCEMAPFDHPEITLPSGHPSTGGALNDSDGDGRGDDTQLVLPAVGAGGLTQSGLPCVGGFLGSPARSLRINFQPAAATAPPGYLVDSGDIYGPRPSGLSYGWNVDNRAAAYQHNAPNSPDARYDTLLHMHSSYFNPYAYWEIAVPNGTYHVRVVSGDPVYTNSVYKVSVEGVPTISGTPSASSRWFDNTVTVTVSDGKLSVTNTPGAINNKINFIEISAATTPDGLTPDPADSPAVLAAAYGFEEGSGTTARDASTHNNDGTLVNGPQWTAGRFGGALSFDGVNDYVTVPASESLAVAPPFTVSAWIQNRDPSHSWERIVNRKAAYNSPDGWEFTIADPGYARGAIAVLGSGGTTALLPCVTDWRNVNLNQWVHVAVVYQPGGAVQLYCNGALTGSGTVGPVAPNSRPVLIGRTDAEPDKHWRGLLDEIRIHRRALSPAEIQTAMGRPVP